MKLKTDDKGVVVQDGKPVYVHDDGKEVAFDAVATVATIGRLNNEAKNHRERAEAAEGKLKSFDGIADPSAALKALEVVKNLDDKKLVDAGQLDQVKAETIKAVEEKYKPYVKRSEALEQQLREEKIGGSFARSKFIGDKLAIPPDMVQSRFGQQFKIEDGRAVAYDSTGNKLYSRARPGELADFDEALEMIVDQYPYKDHILKGTGATGTGAKGSVASGGQRTMTRASFEALGPMERGKAMKEGTRLVD